MCSGVVRNPEENAMKLNSIDELLWDKIYNRIHKEINGQVHTYTRRKAREYIANVVWEYVKGPSEINYGITQKSIDMHIDP